MARCSLCSVTLQCRAQTVKNHESLWGTALHGHERDSWDNFDYCLSCNASAGQPLRSGNGTLL
eukprot:1160102-Pelagomonas_calceolata.AAC.5